MKEVQGHETWKARSRKGPVDALEYRVAVLNWGLMAAVFVGTSIAIYASIVSRCSSGTTC